MTIMIFHNILAMLGIVNAVLLGTVIILHLKNHRLWKLNNSGGKIVIILFLILSLVSFVISICHFGGVI